MPPLPEEEDEFDLFSASAAGSRSPQRTAAGLGGLGGPQWVTSGLFAAGPPPVPPRTPLRGSGRRSEPAPAGSDPAAAAGAAGAQPEAASGTANDAAVAAEMQLLLRLVQALEKNSGEPKMRLAKMPAGAGDRGLPSAKTWKQWYDVRLRTWAAAFDADFEDELDQYVRA